MAWEPLGPDLPAETGSETTPSPETGLKPSDLGPMRARDDPEAMQRKVDRMKERMAIVREYHQVKQASLRQEVRTLLLAKAKDLLERMDKKHIEFMGKDADQVTYPIAPASAVRAYAQSVAALLKEYRNDIGEAGETTATNLGVPDAVYSDHERTVLNGLITEAIALAEREAGAGGEAGEVDTARPAEGTGDDIPAAGGREPIVRGDLP